MTSIFLSIEIPSGGIEKLGEGKSDALLPEFLRGGNFHRA
jgi:hypothetical protein